MSCDDARAPPNPTIRAGSDGSTARIAPGPPADTACHPSGITVDNPAGPRTRWNPAGAVDDDAGGDDPSAEMYVVGFSAPEASVFGMVSSTAPTEALTTR